MNRTELASHLHQFLDVTRFRDYCPNGLQVEGRADIGSIVTAVTASAAAIEAALAAGADALIVHHGYFWRGEDQRITGIRRERLKALLSNDLNLFAYHLPLDAHPEVGNNAQLARRLGFVPEGRFGDQELGVYGTVSVPLKLAELGARIATRLERTPLVVGEPERPVRRVAWCTGAAQGLMEQALEFDVDVYISGEISEPTAHLARESGVAYIAAGHHATERYGVQALGEHLARRFGVSHRFVDIANPA
ncbi:MAG TPA: Nif3-like dinuclear metal center hexameric protein [Burkholderiales bacterium]|nr:Nif3-like dinuclear metal center hexameric protein [Burkholderiales bacterium]